MSEGHSLLNRPYPPGPLIMPGLSQRIAQPFETFVKSVARRGASGLDVLLPLSACCFRMSADFQRTHARCLRLWRPSLSVISAAFMAFWTSSVTVSPSGAARSSIPADLACWRTPKAERLATRLHSTFAATPHELRRHGRDHCCRRRR